MSFKSVSVLNNYVKSLKDKKVIYKDSTGVYRYNDIVKPNGNLESLTFKFVVTETAVQARYEIETLDVLFAFELQLGAELEGQNILYDTEIFIGLNNYSITYYVYAAPGKLMEEIIGEIVQEDGGTYDEVASSDESI